MTAFMPGDGMNFYTGAGGEPGDDMRNRIDWRAIYPMPRKYMEDMPGPYGRPMMPRSDRPDADTPYDSKISEQQRKELREFFERMKNKEEHEPAESPMTPEKASELYGTDPRYPNLRNFRPNKPMKPEDFPQYDDMKQASYDMFESAWGIAKDDMAGKKKALIACLKKEGGACSLEQCCKACDMDKKSCKAMIDSMDNVKMHPSGDVILMDGL
tara:strand:+ start:567 stop:1205 length:639 start_codon:yes stop_codon:yes gene_type:complete